MTLAGALVSCTFLGLQHGIDVDHVAAITDVTSIQRTPLDATRCGLLYAVGHAATVGLLGIGVITLKHSVPPQASMWMERVIGMTLVLLGAYVFASLFNSGAPMGRGRAPLSIIERIRRRPVKEDTAGGYGPRSSLSLGAVSYTHLDVYKRQVLDGQGSNAPEGAHNYLVKGKLVGGFGLVAWPAEYGATGIHTFIVNQDGVVYQKDIAPVPGLSLIHI